MYSISDKLKIEKIRWHNHTKIKTYERIVEYYDLCNQLTFSEYTKAEARFRPFIKKSKLNEFKSTCTILSDSLFPYIKNENITFQINHNDSTITIENRTNDSISIVAKDEWNYKTEGTFIGKVKPNSTETISLEYCFYLHGWMQFLEFKKSEIIIKRKIINTN
jgi:hypothetical protein